VTEVADTLVRREGVSFREAHHLVSAAVKQLDGTYSDAAMAQAVEALAPSHFGRALRISRADLLQALDARHFVDVRRIPGGTAPEAMRPALTQGAGEVAETRVWIERKTAELAAYPVSIGEECRTLLNPG
jgi:argininosuccinate lyase